jgi:hypothetical protein
MNRRPFVKPWSGLFQLTDQVKQLVFFAKGATN